MDVFQFSYPGADRPLLGRVCVAVCLVGGVSVPVGQNQNVFAMQSNLEHAWIQPGMMSTPVKLAVQPSFTNGQASYDSGQAGRRSADSLPQASGRTESAAGLVTPTRSDATKPAGDRYSYVVRIELPPAMPIAAPMKQHPAALAIVPAERPKMASGPALREVNEDAGAAVIRVAVPQNRDLIRQAGMAQPLAIEPAEPQAIRFEQVSAPSELQAARFDLAQLPASRLVETRPSRVAAMSARRAGNGGVPKDTVSGEFVFHTAELRVGDGLSGTIAIRIGSDSKPSIKLGDLLAKVAGSMGAAMFAHLSASASAAEYVGFSKLRDAGFDVSYDPLADQLKVSVAA
ncbi:MAG: hypothetical protein AB7E24_03620 [Novosphingobium sp.]